MLANAKFCVAII